MHWASVFNHYRKISCKSIERLERLYMTMYCQPCWPSFDPTPIYCHLLSPTSPWRNLWKMVCLCLVYNRHDLEFESNEVDLSRIPVVVRDHHNLWWTKTSGRRWKQTMRWPVHSQCHPITRHHIFKARDQTDPRLQSNGDQNSRNCKYKSTEWKEANHFHKPCDEEWKGELAWSSGAVGPSVRTFRGSLILVEASKLELGNMNSYSDKELVGESTR